MDVGVKVATQLGQDVVLVGSHPSLGSWSMDGALPLKWTDGHVWRASVELPPDCAEVEYKVS
jgi:alpha-amylase